jgi:cyclophilin family peptidyl-prolyl cis-trans isomerase
MKALIPILLILTLLVGCTNGGDNMETKNTIVILETSEGNIEIELFEEQAPISTKNFIDYVNEGYYDNLIFHRVISNFMVQGGGFDKDMNQKETKDPIKNEATNGLKNERGTLAMARTGVVDSATSQFFINVVDNTFLDHTAPTPQGYGYAVFAKVISGIEVVDKIKAVQTGEVKGMQDVPLEPILIKTAKIKK